MQTPLSKVRQLRKKLRSLPAAKRNQFIREQRNAGIDSIKLMRAGATPIELKEAEAMAIELKKVRLNLAQLKKFIRTARALRAAGTRWKDMLGSAGEIYKLWRHGRPISELRKAGYTTEQMLKAEATVPELLEGGYSKEEINKALGKNRQ